MRPEELYRTITTSIFIKVGRDVDYLITPNREDKTIYVFFQGSTSSIDWITNFTFPVEVYKHQDNTMFCHRGYVQAWKSCNDAIMDKLFIFINLYQDYKVHFVGHSFGGAMCQLAAEDFYYRSGFKAKVTSFGSPKIFFGKKSVEYIKGIADFIEYANHNDIVSYCIPLPGYKHINSKKIGERFSIFKVFNAIKYHLNYDAGTLYV